MRESIRDVFQHTQGRVPAVDVLEPKVVVVAHLARGRCMLSLDTSGKSLHKRGYREQGHPAPLKETLAAAILIMAGYDGTQPFLDPMCGSGTLAMVMAPDTGQVLIQRVTKRFGTYMDLGSMPFTWQANQWYRMEVEWLASGIINGRVYDSQGMLKQR